MARQCFVCSKQTMSGNAVSHSNRKVRRRWQCNLQRVRIMVKGTPQRAFVCSRCLRSNKVERAI
ncbi:MAG TPA: 50S ribosomal protein L28 [Firmicutes bacterium]|nr:50S ribosomal protein L28 [Bacillota bacterium]